MKFCEAMELLKTGSKVTRLPWKDGIYFQIEDEDVKSFQPRLSPFLYNEDIMVSEGWFVEGIENELNFCDIILFLLKGARARMKDWTDTYIFLDNNTKSMMIQSMIIFPFTPDFESFVAEDWVVVE